VKAKIFWVGLIVALLSMTVLTYGVGLILAISDPSFAVEENYEQKAENWDEIQRERHESDQLGWTIDLSVKPGGIRGEADVSLELYDQWGKAIHEAIVEVECFHNARAADIQRTQLDFVADQYYGKRMMLQRSGLWEFRLRITAGDDIFVKKLRKSVVVGK
jgi:nitrogen fixation protein FixH